MATRPLVPTPLFPTPYVTIGPYLPWEFSDVHYDLTECNGQRASGERILLTGRVLELGGESGVECDPHVYPGSYVEYVARTGHEAPGVHH